MIACGERPSLREPFAVAAIWALTVLATVVTYARLPVSELWNVSQSGIAGGFSRALVHLNFPIALVAVAFVLVALERLPEARWRWIGGVAIALSAVIALPGVVRSDDLDARWINAVPAVGVGLAVVLLAAAYRRGGLGQARGRVPIDPVRLMLGAVLLAVSLPWIGALLGFYVNAPYLGSKIIPEAGHPDLAAVHHGLHHGLYGSLLAATALVLSRVVPQLRPSSRRSWLAGYLSVMVVYGLANAANDAWLEQVVKRGWAGARMPSVTEPTLNGAWLGVLVLGGALAAIVLYRLRGERADAPPPARVPA